MRATLGCGSPSVRRFTSPAPSCLPSPHVQLMAQEAGLNVDMAGFQVAMEAAKELSRAGQKKGGAAELKFEAEATAYLANGCAGTPRCAAALA